MQAYLKGLILIVLLLFLTTFGIKNSQMVKLDYYFKALAGEIPVYGLVYLSLLIGCLVGMLVGIFQRFDQRRRIKTLQRENRTLKEKLAAGPTETEPPVQPTPTEPAETE